jgi:DNA-binding MarR family transcriptional regulator
MSRTPPIPENIRADSPFLRLRELGEAAGLLEQVMADRLGLARTDLGVLSLLAMHGPQAAGELAEATGLTTGAVTGCLDRLERVGFARRSADPGDRRRVMVTLRMERLGRVAELNHPLVEALSALDAKLTGAQGEMVADYVRRAAGHFREVALQLRAEGRRPPTRPRVKRRRAAP